MRIDDEIYVHGYLDEIRQDKVIIRNEGGYFGTVVGELVEAIPKVDYETRLKAAMVAMLTEIQLEIEEHEMTSGVINQDAWNECIACCSRIVQQKINALKAESEVEE